VRANDPEALARLQLVYPAVSATAALREVQHALAREYGFNSWIELKNALGQGATPLRDVASPLERFLECACPDHHVRGLTAHRMATHAAMRVLENHPEIARESIYTAVVCGELDQVRRILTERPELVNAKRAVTGPDRSGGGGSYDFLSELGGKPWEPLLYLCFTRLPLAKANDNAVEIARLLLDHGADPNAFFVAGNCSYTPLVGVVGEGEEGRPGHPHRDELARLLLERGAALYDGQVNYNIHFQGKVLWWLKLMYEFSIKAGRAADWADPEWPVFDAGGYGSGARWYLRTAVEHNNLELAEWCLAHGANPNPAPESDQRFPQSTLYEFAMRQGRTEIAELLARHGAPRIEIALDEEEQYVAAGLRLDRDAVQRALAQHPEYLQSTKAMFAAAKRDRADVVAFLLELGTPLEVRDDKNQRALHVAAANDAVNVAKLLIERGAQIDPYELNYSNTPLDFAAWNEYGRMTDLLRPHSKDVWNLTTIGDLDRLREIIPAEPDLAKVTWQTTPLFWLPEDEGKALEIVELFLDHGADAGFRSKQDGTIASDIARNRGMLRVAALLESAAGDASREDANEQLLQEYEEVAQAIVAAYESDDEEARGRIGRHFNRIVTFEELRRNIQRRIVTAVEHLALDDARDLVAKLSGFTNWAGFLKSVKPPAKPHTADDHTRAAEDFVKAYEKDEGALARLNAYYDRSFTFEDVRAEIWRRVYAFRQRAFKIAKNYLLVEEAQVIVAQDAGFGSWDALMKGLATGAPPPGAPYVIDAKESRVSPRRRMTSKDWDEMIEVIREHRIKSVDAGGLMTDGALARIVEIDHVTSLSLGGSRELTDDGVLQLARMPQLERLNLSEYPGGKLTDRGLEVLKHLPYLRDFEMTWQAGITDAGIANLQFCEQLENVDLMGSPTGDGAIAALQGKPKLRRFGTGRLTTDAGLPLLQNFPLMKRWHAGGARLLIDGPFTDAGLAGIVGLEGVEDLDLFWHVDHVTAEGFAHLVRLPNLMKLGCDGELSNNAAMRHIGMIPRLRALRAQESAATDEGFEALAQSKTLEGFWGRNSEHFGSRAMIAFSKMPSLKNLGVSLKSVGDDALATLPNFPELRELTPVGLEDEGFRHVGKCARLERLTCMYCRDTTDLATEHIGGLTIRYYYAGLTKITDRSLQILGGMHSLEQIDLYECKGVTDAGLVFLAGLPRLREVHLDECPAITLDGTKVFPENVRVSYST
jgi:ankyrin repeat protein